MYQFIHLSANRERCASCSGIKNVSRKIVLSLSKYYRMYLWSTPLN